MEITSPKFSISQPWIPKKYTCDEDNISPPIQIAMVPDEAKSLVLIMDDLDLPGGIMSHWLLWNIPAGKEILEQDNHSVGTAGKNRFGNNGYNGPCPPENSTHRYRFRIFALDKILDLQADSGQPELESAMKGHIIDQTELLGSYTRISIEIEQAEEIVGEDSTSDGLTDNHS